MGRLDYSLAVLLAFDCYLRVGELVGLQVGQVTIGGPDSHLPANMMGGIDLPKSKTGTNQSVLPRCPVVLGLLRFLTAGRRKADRLFSFSAAAFRKARSQGGMRGVGCGFPLYVRRTAFEMGGITGLHVGHAHGGHPDTRTVAIDRELHALHTGGPRTLLDAGSSRAPLSPGSSAN
jgi:hypothetical protein